MNFTKSFTQQEPIAEDAIEAAVAVMRSGRLHRYNTAPGEESETAALEREFAEWQGVDFALAVTSGGQAMQIALRAAGVKPGDKVLTNAFTLAPVPGAIAAVGAQPIFVETTADLVIDLDDLAAKAAGAEVLLLSHMRGHLADMDALSRLCCSHGIKIIEDCAHTMGAEWAAKKSGNFGYAACFSNQTYKHINSGEGGFLTSKNAEFMARATILSGSYMLYPRHGAGPDEAAYAEARRQMPNCSARMDNLRAALLRPQLKTLDTNIVRWNERHDALRQALAHLHLPAAPNEALRVGSSFQFFVPEGWDADAIRAFVARCGERGVELKWFGDAEPVGFTSRYDSWGYAPKQELPRTINILHRLIDMRVPLSFDVEDCRLIAAIIAEEVAA
ncbi:MAG: aminotransferase class I/II-fold pyridoxal phosphate-dependent enzyme [Pseudomonadota bacterium]